MMIHEQVIRSGYESDLFIGSSLVDVYARCGCLQEAHAVFDNLKNKNAVSWAALIIGYAQHGEGQCSMELLERMHLENVDIDRIAFVSIIKACSSVGGLKQGRLLNKKMLEKGLFPDNLLGNALVDMYSRCGDLDDASCIFKRLLVQDVISWGAIIAGYDGCGFSFEALSLFDQMQQAGVQANTAVFLPVLNACSFLNYVEHGMLIHGQLVEQNEMMDMAIANKLVDMYTKTGKIEEAESVFRAMEYRDLVSWGAMILGCADHGHGPAALDFFQEMWQECIEADKTIFLCVLKACASTSAIKLARLIHFQVVASGHNDDRDIENTLLDTYSKLGSIDDSCRVFDGLVGPDTVSWAAMIAGYARCGILQIVHQCLKDMKQQGLQPHAGIFSSVLLGCTHAGVLNEGYQFFKSMINEYGITPNVEHYHCIVDLLGRVGQLKEAIAMLVTMPAMSDMIVWTSLLTSCKTYHNVELGKVCLDEILRIDPDDASAYLLMASIYAGAGMWEEVRRLRVLRRLAGAQKKRGVTFLEVDNKVYEFVVGEKCASMIEPVYLKAERINRLIRSSAYLPQVESVVDLPSMEL
ncbi:hypothetical protein KP509_04G059000 [Ceratopteris richardii]|nr:hypothetical protein KP509_04G059000 [Ceratopteris richardii]